MASTSYVYDGDNVVADVQGGSASKFYVTPFLDQNLSMTDVSSGNTYYYTNDGLGSVRTLSDSSGTLQNKYDYNAFGQKYSPNTTTTIDQRYTYTGREKTSSPSLMYYRWRMYDNSIGRFSHRDPIGYRGGINIYGYVFNNPVSNYDSSGQLSLSSIVSTIKNLISNGACYGYNITSGAVTSITGFTTVAHGVGACWGVSADALQDAANDEIKKGLPLSDSKDCDNPCECNKILDVPATPHPIGPLPIHIYITGSLNPEVHFTKPSGRSCEVSANINGTVTASYYFGVCE